MKRKQQPKNSQFKNKLDEPISKASSSKMPWIIAGAILGATAAYVLDPEKGRSRRAVLKDKAKSLTHKSYDYSEKLLKRFSNQAMGVKAKATRMFRHIDTDDERLVRRVRSAIGHYVSHSQLIEVLAENGEVTLKGPVLESEIDNLVSQIETVPGVKLVIDHLDVYDAPEQLANLSPRKEVFQ